MNLSVNSEEMLIFLGYPLTEFCVKYCFERLDAIDDKKATNILTRM